MPARADLTVSVFNDLSKGTDAEKTILENYIGGVGKGYLWANVIMSQTGQTPLFCFKGDYTTGQLRDIAANAVAKHLTVKPSDTEMPVEILLLISLQQKHPCSKK